MALNKETPKGIACVIWMHGLGSSGDDMKGLAQELSLPNTIEHVFLDAPIRPVTINGGMPMPAWYDILGDSLTDREDKPGIMQSTQQVEMAITKQLQAGYRLNQLFLAGFSQGGAMALYAALQQKQSLAGVISLSAYLPLSLECQAYLPKETPVFFGSGRFDNVVLPSWTAQSAAWFTKNGYNHLTIQEYPMAHTVCHQELRDLSAWLLQQVQGITS